MPNKLSCFERGQKALNRGRTRKALRFFDKAAQCSETDEIVAVTEHMRGICLRMLKQYVPAEAAFTAAFDLASNRTLKGRIKRDAAMIPLEQRDALKARERIDASLELLQPSQTGSLDAVEEHERRIEYFVSLGFDARVAVLEGRTDYAYQTYRLVRQRLRGIAPYELNALACEMKIAPFSQRISKLMWRGLWLSLRAPHPGRFAQVLALTFCRPVALRFG